MACNPLVFRTVILIRRGQYQRVPEKLTVLGRKQVRLTAKAVDWDQWNVQKNEVKHGVSRREAESAFFDAKYRLFSDEKHSSAREQRFILFGMSMENRVLMVGFTLRRERVRIITA